MAILTSTSTIKSSSTSTSTIKGSSTIKSTRMGGGVMDIAIVESDTRLESILAKIGVNSWGNTHVP